MNFVSMYGYTKDEKILTRNQLKTSKKNFRRTFNRRHGGRTQEVLGQCQPEAHDECAPFGNGAAIEKFAQLPNAIVRAFQVSTCRNTQFCRDAPSAQSSSMCPKHTLDQHAAHLGVSAHAAKAL
jgi:hypothetical protein